MTIKLYVDIEESVKREAKAKAALAGLSLNEYVENALKEYNSVRTEHQENIVFQQ